MGISSESNQFVDIFSPLNQSLVGSVPAMSTHEVDCTIAAAKEAQKVWKLKTVNQRAEILYN